MEFPSLLFFSCFFGASLRNMVLKSCRIKTSAIKAPTPLIRESPVSSETASCPSGVFLVVTSRGNAIPCSHCMERATFMWLILQRKESREYEHLKSDSGPQTASRRITDRPRLWVACYCGRVFFDTCNFGTLNHHHRRVGTYRGCHYSPFVGEYGVYMWCT